jgi:hypothetical protein
VLGLQEELRRIFAEVDATLAGALPPGWRAEQTGPFAVVHEMVDEIQRSQLGSFAGATVLVLGLIARFQRSWKAALLAAVPTLLPVLVTLGALGFAGISLDIGGTMVAAVVIGIADDDAAPARAVRCRRRSGMPAAEAMHDALPHVGRAMVTTSVALATAAALSISSGDDRELRVDRGAGDPRGAGIRAVVLPACVNGRPLAGLLTSPPARGARGVARRPSQRRSNITRLNQMWTSDSQVKPMPPCASTASRATCCAAR